MTATSESRRNGKDILSQETWTPKVFEEAIEAGLTLLRAGSLEYEDLTATLRTLASHLMQLREAERIEELREYNSMLGDLMLRHPELPRMRDLHAEEQAGVRIELLIEEGMQYDALPTIAKAKTVLRDSYARLVIETLISKSGWVEFAELDSFLDTSRPIFQRVMSVLGSSGLLVTAGEVKQARYRATELAKRAIAAM